MNRRLPIRFRESLLWLAFLLLVAGCTVPLDDTVRVESGLLAGTTGADSTVHVFKGIPYAAPPVGDLRWRPPQPVASWDGTREADEFASSCMQHVVGSLLPWTEVFMVQNATSEDCLYLNVWTAATTADERRPVLVYIHGGAFTQGSGAVGIYDGEALAKKGLVVVTINYRLGVFGLLAHPGLTAESSHDASGNYGLLDQMAALEWVQHNIAAFGGDPTRVTIAGQSAGAASVHALLASPLAEGLFHRAILQSGSSFAFGASQPLADAEQAGVEFAESMGIDSIEALRALSADTLLERSRQARFRPNVDGWLLPDDIHHLSIQGRQHDVPVLAGATADEGTALTPATLTAEAFRGQARQQYGDRADAFLNLYPADTDEAARQSGNASFSDRLAWGAHTLARIQAETGTADAYLYRFDRVIPWPEHPEYGAFHSSELPYVFDNLDLLDRPWEPVDRELADVTSTYWVNFAATGDPNGEGLPAWPVYDEQGRRFMILDREPEPRVALDDARIEFFDAQLASQEASP